MWDPEHIPGAAPWQLLIGARFVHQIDAALAAAVTHHVGSRAPIGPSAAAGVTRSVAQVTRTSAAQRGSAIIAVLDFEDFCAANDDLDRVLLAAADLVRTGGSEHLRGTLGVKLEQLTGALTAR